MDKSKVAIAITVRCGTAKVRKIVFNQNLVPLDKKSKIYLVRFGKES